MAKSGDNSFANDGSFLEKFLLSVNSNASAAVEQAETNCGGDVFTATTKGKRKFSEAPPIGSGRKQRQTADCAVPPNGLASETSAAHSDQHSPTAADLQLEAVRHLDLSEEVARPKADELEEVGTVEGGTWEHRKRAKEMIRTANLSAAITQVSVDTKLTNKGAGIGGYLPPELAAALQQKFDSAATQGVSVDSTDMLAGVTDGKSITKSNKGYKMLQQSGWTEGKGLGKDGEGICTPIPAVEKTVLGEESTPTDGSGDDAFSQYRKRMMLAYRFRPNPLNNPRRSYDGYQTLYDSKAMNSVLGKVEELKKKTQP